MALMIFLPLKIAILNTIPLIKIFNHWIYNDVF